MRANGVRMKTLDKDGKWLDTYIQWTTNVMHKYSQGDKLCLITSHECYPQQGDLVSTGVTAFMLLSLIEEGAKGSPQQASKLDGMFFVTGKAEDTLFQARIGRVVFERPKANLSQSSR